MTTEMFIIDQNGCKRTMSIHACLGLLAAYGGARSTMLNALCHLNVAGSSRNSHTLSTKLVLLYKYIFLPFLSNYVAGCGVRAAHGNHVFKGVRRNINFGQASLVFVPITCFQMSDAPGSKGVELNGSKPLAVPFDENRVMRYFKEHATKFMDLEKQPKSCSYIFTHNWKKYLP